ncbi:hypothetical protein COI08_06855 [Neisseria meningitidis]|nr:hypothetical protein COI08_06855 [Neisseria meningitidis]RQJ83236.1 hypothetical protein COI05_09395 [Neisseria meningitidis]
MRPLIYRTSELDSRLRGNDEAIRTETCTTSFPQGQKTKIRNLKSRHSHESGNLDLRTTAIFKDYLKV